MIPFIDLPAQQARIKPQVEAAIAKVLAHGGYVLGPEVAELETQLAAFAGAKHCITCSDGTDALSLALMTLDIKPGQVVFVPGFTFVATAQVVVLAGAIPYFVDVHPHTFNIDIDSLGHAIHEAKNKNLDIAGIISVDLFGLPADFNALQQIADANNLWLLNDAAQSYGASYQDKRVGSYNRLTTTSFFPAKVLGCYGDGGAVFCNSDEDAARLRSHRMYGQGTHKYENVRFGLNSRLDTIQAAVLLEKLRIFPDEITARQRVADRYSTALKDVCITPMVAAGYQSVWAQYTVQVPASKREAIQAQLKDAGIPTMVYYPIPLHQQFAYKQFPVTDGRLATSETLCQTVLSLPMHPYLEETAQDMIITEFRKALA